MRNVEKDESKSQMIGRKKTRVPVSFFLFRLSISCAFHFVIMF